MTRKLTTAFLFLSAAIPLSARPAAAQSMTLGQCIDVALKKNPDVASAVYEIEAAEAQRKSARGGFMPRLKLDAGIQRWDREAKVPLMGGFVGLLNYGLGKNGLSALQDTDMIPTGPTTQESVKQLTADTVVRRQITWSASATLAQPLAALWTVNEGYKARKLGVDVAEIGRKTADRDVTFQVTEAYYRLLQATRMAEVAQKSVDNIDAQVKRADAFFRMGTVGKNDLLRAQLGLAAAKQRLIQAKGGVELARGRLAMVMGLPPETPIAPADSVEDVKPAPIMPAEMAESRAVSERLELKQIATRIEQARAGESLAKSRMIPQVNAVASLQFQPTSAFSPYSHAWFIGAVASWDIFEGGATYYGISEARSRVAQAQAARRKAEDGIRLEARSAQVNLITATEALEVARAAVEQAEENFRIEQKRYEAANNTSFDVLDAENQLTTARGQHQAAIYEYLIAQSNLARATGETSPQLGSNP
jgi:outer membrane protein TolC